MKSNVIIICWVVFGSILVSFMNYVPPLLQVRIFDDQEICQNSVPELLTSQVTPPDPGGYIYRWLDSTASTTWDTILGAEASTYQPPQLVITTYYLLVVRNPGNNQTQVSDNMVNIKVFENLEAGNVTGDTNQVCFNEDAGSLHANPRGGDSLNYSFIWLKNSDTVDGQYTETLNIGELNTTSSFQYIVTDKLCDTLFSNNTFTINVYDSLEANDISGGNDNVCYHGCDTLNANVKGGSETYSFIWYRGISNPVEIGTGNTIILNNLEDTAFYFYRVHDAKCGDAESEPVPVYVYDELRANNITGPNDTLCNGEKATLTANPTGGSGLQNFTIKWYKESGGGQVGSGLEYTTPELDDITGFYYTVTDNQGCGTDESEIFKCTVYPILEVGTITAEIDTICKDEDGGRLTASPGGGSGDYSYQWFANDLNMNWSGQVYEAGSLSETTEFYYKVIDNEGCDIENNESPPVKIVVLEKETASVSITSSNSESCEGEAITFTANPSPPLSGVEYSWSINNGPEISSQQQFETNSIKDGDVIKVVVTYFSSCIDNSPVSNTYTATVNPLPPGDPIIAKPHNDPVVLIYPADTTGIHLTYQWFRDGVPLNGETKKFYYSSTQNGGILADGYYSITITNEYECSISLSFDYKRDESTLFYPTDIFTIYPNPNQGEFTFRLNDDQVPDDIEEFQFRILDPEGRVAYDKVLQCNDQMIYMPGMNKGIYLMEVKVSAQFRQVKKLIIY
jgi:hypothetical protein